MSKNVPHKAILNIRLEVHELLNTGECSGKVINDKKLIDNNIKPASLVSIDGNTLEECLEKVKNKLESLYE